MLFVLLCILAVLQFVLTSFVVTDSFILIILSRPLKRARTEICGASDPEVQQVQNFEEF